MSITKTASQTWNWRNGVQKPFFFEKGPDDKHMKRVSEKRGRKMLDEGILPWTEQLKIYFGKTN